MSVSRPRTATSAGNGYAPSPRPTFDGPAAIPFAAVTSFVDPAVNFALQFQAQADDEGPDTTAEGSNDAPAEPVEDGSNVVSVDFTRKK